MPDPTIYDVADQAQVSISTVSRVLNAPEQVNRETRTRVLAAIDALGFVPKAQAVDRARKTTGRIGVLAPFFTYPSFVDRLRGVAERLASTNLELVIYNIDTVSKRDHNLATLPLTRRLDGLIVMSLPLDEVTIQRLLKSNLETIMINAPHPSINSVEVDDVLGGQMAALHLLGAGHKRYVFMGDGSVPPYVIDTTMLRLRGFCTTLAHNGIKLGEDNIVLIPYGMETARQHAHSILERAHPPTAIFAASDAQAIGILKAAREKGLRVPDDLAVVGYDDIAIADYIGLTTVRQPLEESGRIAVDLLLNRLADRTRTVQHVRLPLTLVRRETA